jgi:predicted ABC-type ATPase
LIVRPPLIVLAGPNGAGKSTFFEAYLSALGLPFLNADRLASATGMSAYEAAAEIAGLRRVLVEQGIGFVTETVLSDPVGDKVQFLAHAEKVDFDVHLIFIGITDAAMSARRVESRVKAGGHDVPRQKIFARYERTLVNLERAIERLSRVTIYDNSSYDEPYRFVAEFRSGKLREGSIKKLPDWMRRVLLPR